MYLFHCSDRPSILIPSEDQQKDWLGEGNREICCKKNPFENAVSASSELASRQHCTVVRRRLKSIVWASSEPAPDASALSVLTIAHSIAPSCTAHIKPRLQMFCCTPCNPHSADFNRSLKAKSLQGLPMLHFSIGAI